MRNAALMVMAVIIGLATLRPHSITAQQETSNEQSPEAKEDRGPLPFYFGKLGLSEQQKVKLYQIQESYDEQIDKLNKQIEHLEDQRDKSMETLLTPGQKLRLKELREEARLKKERADQEAATTPSEDKAD